MKHLFIILALGLVIVFASCEEKEELEIQEVQEEVKVEETQQAGFKSSAVFLKQGSFNLKEYDKVIRTISGSDFDDTDLFQFTIIRNTVDGTFYVRSFLDNGNFTDNYNLIPQTTTNLKLVLYKSQLNSNVTSLKLMCTNDTYVSGSYIILGTD